MRTTASLLLLAVLAGEVAQRRAALADGLAQHLWFAKLKFERLSSTLSEEDRPLATEVTQALDAAILETHAP